ARKCLYRDARDVVERLLDRKGNAGRLRMKSHLHRAGIFCAESLFHRLCPNDASGAVLGDLLEKVVVGVEEERNAGNKLIDVHSAVNAVLYILDATAKGA